MLMVGCHGGSRSKFILLLISGSIWTCARPPRGTRHYTRAYRYVYYGSSLSRSLYTFLLLRTHIRDRRDGPVNLVSSSLHLHKEQGYGTADRRQTYIMSTLL